MEYVETWSGLPFQSHSVTPSHEAAIPELRTRNMTSWLAPGVIRLPSNRVPLSLGGRPSINSNPDAGGLYPSTIKEPCLPCHTKPTTNACPPLFLRSTENNRSYSAGILTACK